MKCKIWRVLNTKYIIALTLILNVKVLKLLLYFNIFVGMRVILCALTPVQAGVMNLADEVIITIKLVVYKL